MVWLYSLSKCTKISLWKNLLIYLIKCKFMSNECKDIKNYIAHSRFKNFKLILLGFYLFQLYREVIFSYSYLILYLVASSGFFFSRYKDGEDNSQHPHSLPPVPVPVLHAGPREGHSHHPDPPGQYQY